MHVINFDLPVADNLTRKPAELAELGCDPASIPMYRTDLGEVVPKNVKEALRIRWGDGRDPKWQLTYRDEDGRKRVFSTGCSLGDEEQARHVAAAFLIAERDTHKSWRGLDVWRIDRISIGELLDEYLENEQGEDITYQAWKAKLRRVRRLRRALGHFTLGDVGKSLVREYRKSSRSENTLVADLRTLRTVLIECLEDHKIGWYRIKLSIPKPPKPRKQALTPDELHRLLQAARGYIWDKGTGAWGIEVDPKTGELVLSRRSERTLAARRALMRFIIFAALTGSRGGVVRRASYLDTTGPFIDLMEGAFYRHRKHGPDDNDIKRGGRCELPPPLLMAVREWAAGDLASGTHFMMHKAGGKPYADLNRTAWHELVADAGLDDRRGVNGKPLPRITPHGLKDLCVDILLAEGATYAQMADFLSTTTRTLEWRYGSECNFAAQRLTANMLAEPSNWLRWNEAHRQNLEIFDAARGTALPDAGQPRLAPPPLPWIEEWKEAA